jgi:NAD(P)-dependent dehydrogenase (short-subunit alcohol dehydrogenase family)
MPVAYDLTGKTAVVTGGAKGIGKSITDLLAASGARVHVWDLNPTDSNSASWTKLDVTDRSQIKQAIDVLVGSGAKVDILVNNAGYLGTYHAFDEHDPADWLRVSR